LWIVGLFAGSASGTCNTGLNFGPPGGFGSTGSGGEQFPSDLGQVFGQAGVQQAINAFLAVLPILLAFAAGLVLLGLLVWLLSIACKAAVIAGGGPAVAGEPVTLGLAWRTGMRAFGRLFGLELLWFLIWIVVLGLIALFTISSVSNQPLERVNWLSLLVGLGGVFVLVGIVSSVLSVVLAFAQRAIVLDGTGTLEGVRRGFGIVRGALGNTIILWLISAALSIAGGIVLAIALIVACIPALILGGILTLLVNALGGPGIAALITVVILVLVVAALIGGAVLNTFLWHFWTAGYVRLTAPPVVVAAAPVPAPVEPPPAPTA
jgi:hypothetical protein